MDQHGQLWLGLAGGLNRRVERPSLFKTMEHHPNQPNSLSHNIIKAVHRDQNGDLWVGTINGLNYLDSLNFETQNLTFTTYYPAENNPNSLVHKNIFDLAEDSQGYLWIATYGGINILDTKNSKKPKQFRRLTVEDGLIHKLVYSILEIEPNQYWISSAGGLSLMKYDPGQATAPVFEHFEMDEEQEGRLINSMNYQVCKDKYGDYWIATFNGLSKYADRPGQNYFENYLHIPGDSTSLSHNSVITLFQDAQKNLWVGTRGGLDLVLQEDANTRVRFRHFGIQQGFVNDVIQSVEEDSNGYFWIGTNRGLMLFDPEAALNGQSGVLKTFDRANGFAGPGVVFRSSHHDHQGNLFFGSAAGLNYFRPNTERNNTIVPRLAFTSLEILNKEVHPGEGRNPILTKAINHTASIRLKYWQNILSLEFAALEYTQPTKNQYQYQLVGFDKEWIHNGTRNRISYTNLPPGKYTLNVKSSNGDGQWNEEARALKIYIAAPPWQQWWAYLLYLLVVGFSLFLFIRYRINKQMAAFQEAAKIEKAKVEERERLRQKMLQTSMMSWGHRLTKMSLYIELAERVKGNASEAAPFLEKIKTNHRSLSEGIRDLIWSLDPQKDSLYQTLLRLQEFGDKLFEYTSTHFKTMGIDPQLAAFDLEPAVRKHILLMFKEIMHNCLKYAAAQNATLSAEKEVGFYALIFSDDGKGFDLSDQSKGYGYVIFSSEPLKLEPN